MKKDLFIVGGGPAGLATAIEAALRGLSVVLCDRRPLPLDKPCGEGIMPPGVARLRDMGVQLPSAAHVPFHGIRYLDAHSQAEGRFLHGPGWGVRRTRLVSAMFSRAHELGVEMRYGSPIRSFRVAGESDVVIESGRGSDRARFLVGADGLHSRVRREAGLEGALRGRRRFGVRRHFRVKPWTDLVEVHWVSNVEAYVTPVGAEELGVAFLWNGDGRDFDSLLHLFPLLRERLSEAATSGADAGAGPLRRDVPRLYRGPVVLVGDASGYLDALTGEGLSLAFHAASALVSTISHGKPLADYQRVYRRSSRIYYWTTAALLEVARRPRMRSAFLAQLAENDWLFDRLLQISTGERPPRSLGVKGAARLVSTLFRGLGPPFLHFGRDCDSNVSN